MALPPIATATPPITVTKSDGTTISVPSPVTTPLTNGLKMLGAREVIEAGVLDTNFLQLLENFASTTAPTTPIRGQLWYDLNAPAQLKLCTGLAAPNDWEPVSCCDGNLVDPANTTIVAGPTGTLGGGSGTSASPYIINDTAIAGTTKLVGTVTVTGLLPGQFVVITDLNAIVNDSRFSFSNYFADANGDLSFNVYLIDIPASAGGTTYTCALKVGSASVYVDINVAIQATFPVSPINYPTDTTSATTSWTAANDTLTPTGCIEISKDNSTWVSNPSTLSISTGDTLYTRWLGTPGSGTCIDSANGSTITGGITSSNSSTANPASLTVDKTPATITFTAATNQTVSSVTQSNTITVSGINSYAYITGSILNGTNLEASINGGTWTAVPVSGTSMYVINGQTLQLRLTNSASNSTTTTATISVGSTTGITWNSTTVVSTAAIATPSILTPVANATGISTTPTITSSAYSASGGAGTHLSSDWEIATDAAFTNIVASSLNDPTNLISWTVPSALNNSTDYYVRVRYKSNPTTVTSAYSTGIKFTTDSQLGITWTNRGSKTISSLTGTNGAVYANGRYVVATNIDEMLSSIDGITWTTSLAFTGSSPIYSVLYDGSKFIISGFAGWTMTSNDGVTWSNLVTGGAGSLAAAFVGQSCNTMAFNGSVYVAGGDTGILARSTDGTTWTLIATDFWGSSQTVQGIFWTGTRFIAISSVAGECATSTDGITWTNQTGLSTALSGNGAIGIGKNPSGRVVVVGNNGSVATSDDNGTTWTSRTSNVTNNLRSICWDGSKFIAAGAGNKVITSPDGITWTANTLSFTVGIFSANELIPTSSQILAVGSFNFFTSP